MEKTEHISFDLTLDRVIKGNSGLKDPVCHFHVDWNSETNMGIAMLQTINSTPINIVLHPLGIKGQTDFMSDMEPTAYYVNVTDGPEPEIVTIIIYRVILDMDGDKRSAAIMLGGDGETIIASDGFMEESAKKQLPTVELESQEVPEGFEPSTGEE